MVRISTLPLNNGLGQVSAVDSKKKQAKETALKFESKKESSFVGLAKNHDKFLDPKTTMVLNGILEPIGIGTKEGQLHISARVSNLEKWYKLDGINNLTTIKLPSQKLDSNEYYLVTALVLLENADQIRKLDFVKSFKTSTKLSPQKNKIHP